MNCPGPGVMAACLDGALTPAEGARLGLHLRACARCRKALEELAFLLALEPLDPGRASLRAAKALIPQAGATPPRFPDGQRLPSPALLH
ncbi:hypothetical protein NNJEOMEG_02215 [Fundidesulfovibrio magnetotacticus]|uniref:Putative zinc-finger domain-containing protein n=1 Tax=Fundidesulfovibrio magnetotacticus TaxID=2730080 RepID=A0A6V8LUW4_9BACT|nr:zf-HC2 domain-containing protein [Fundidesulfovibrio magnetotacticus]GFK94371.1 hypothetical protein NNJEOMEG_02215 [Fundidesulfovibrio magnetotacticus]